MGIALEVEFRLGGVTGSEERGVGPGAGKGMAVECVDGEPEVYCAA